MSRKITSHSYIELPNLSKENRQRFGSNFKSSGYSKADIEKYIIRDKTKILEMICKYQVEGCTCFVCQSNNRRAQFDKQGLNYHLGGLNNGKE